MARIFATIVTILVLLFFPPTVLALLSNNAVPGDAAYPVKRALETGILTVASVHPSAKAAFTVERSERRYDESIHLIEAGEDSQDVSHSLGELIKHTREAANEVKKLEDPQEKSKKITELKTSIKKYQQGLEAEQKKIEAQPGYQTPSGSVGPTSTPVPGQPTPIPAPSVTTGPTPTLVPGQPIIPTKTPTPTPKKPTSTPAPGTTYTSPYNSPYTSPYGTPYATPPTPTLVPTPTPPPSQVPIDCENPILKNAPECLGQIIEELPDPLPTYSYPSPSAVGDAPLPTQIPTPTDTPTPTPTIPQVVSCTACQANIVEDVQGKVDNLDMQLLDACATFPKLSDFSSHPTYKNCANMDLNGNDKIDSFEISCGRSKEGETCVP